MNSFIEALVTVALAIVGLAILSVVFSPQAQTTKVIESAGNVFTGAIRAATGPISSGFGGGYGLGGVSQPTNYYNAPFAFGG